MKLPPSHPRTTFGSRTDCERDPGVSDYAGLLAARLFGPVPRSLRRLPVLGLRNATSAAPCSLCSAATFSAITLGIASTIPAMPQNQPPNHRAKKTMIGL